MIDFTAYDPVTGEIQSNGSLSEESFEANVQFGMHAVLDVKLSEATHYIDVSGTQHVPREYTEAERAALAGLMPGWVWQMPERRAVDQRTLDTTRAAKVTEINADWDTANASYFVFQGKQISVVPTALVNLFGTAGHVALMGEFPPDWPGGWKCVDNTYVPITDIATWKAFYTAFSSQGTMNFAHAQALKARVAAATSVAELDQIQW